MCDTDDVVIPISALQHYAYCPRQCGLIHVDQVWEDNLFTMRGNRAHRRISRGETTYRDGYRIISSMPLHSAQYRLVGVADVVELRPQGPFPIEYKAGKGPLEPTEVQLCAQALCLEEMLHTPVTQGAIYRRASNRRHIVDLDETLRAETQRTIVATRLLLTSQTLPPPVTDGRCTNCSLKTTCLPDIVADSDRLSAHQIQLYGEDEP